MSDKTFDLNDVYATEHHDCIKDLTKVLTVKTGNEDEAFFRMEVAYFMAKIATCMQCHINIPNSLDIPVNAYVLALSASGSGKGTSISVMEDEIINGFEERYLKDTFPRLAEKNINDLGNTKAIRYCLDPGDCISGLQKRFEELGAYNFTFDSATTPAIKQFRELLNLAGTGAINISIDEIGSNLLNVDEVMRTFLELYDKGKTKAKLVKNSKDNQRAEDFNLPTPANLLMFGTTAKLLNGGAEEDALYSWLQEGYGRRLLFAYGNPTSKEYSVTDAKQVFEQQTDPQIAQLITKWNNHFRNLADEINNHYEVEVPEDVGILYTGYSIVCTNRAAKLPEHLEIQKAEMKHRHFKALKLAGAIAFIDGSPMLTEKELYQAIKLVEEDSGNAFEKLMNRDPSYVKLAKFICSCGKEVTHADLNEELPYYKVGGAARKEQMALARAYGATHNLLIKVETRDNIEFFSGESLQENDLKNIIISSSFDYAKDYTNSFESWDELCKTLPRACDKNGKPLSFINHHLIHGDPDENGQGYGHRQDSDCLEEFNMAVLDIDGSTTMDIAADLLDDYTWLMYATKSSDQTLNRFRLLIPLSHTLKLKSRDYKEFMNNIINWFPFESDAGANQQSRKWNCNPKTLMVYQNPTGKLLNVLPFIPHTSNNDNYKSFNKNITDVGALEKWFYNEINDGAGRNNNIYRYAMILKENGLSLDDVKERIALFNNNLDMPLTERELSDTVYKSLANKY